MSGNDPKYPIIRKRKSEFFPGGGSRTSQKIINDVKDELVNKRRFHGTDPLKDGFDPQENPLRRRVPRRKSDIPI